MLCQEIGLGAFARPGAAEDNECLRMHTIPQF
jgi:hypothetical protein